MTPEERQLLAGLFDRTRAASESPRDKEAEAFIAEALRDQPHATYLLAQAVIVQDQALGAANERLQQLEARVRELEAAQTSGGGSFLGGLFGGGRPATSVPSSGAAQATAVPQAGSPWGRQQNSQPAVQQGQGFGPQAMQAPMQAPMQGGGFLRGALGTAAGVAGGMLLANSISNLFSNHHGSNPLGIGDSASTGGFQPSAQDVGQGDSGGLMSGIFPASADDSDYGSGGGFFGSSSDDSSDI